MLTLIHGDHIAQSRNALVAFKNDHADREIRNIDGGTVTASDLIQSVESQSLFGSTILVVVENLYSKNAKARNKLKEMLLVLQQSQLDIVLWEGKELTKEGVKAIGASRVMAFPIPKYIFSLLDSIKPMNSPQFLSLLGTTMNVEEPEFVHAMILRRFRDLVRAKLDVKSEKQNPWVYSRLTAQARFFTMNQLAVYVRRYYAIDTAMKSGKLAYPLSSAIRIFFMYTVPTV